MIQGINIALTDAQKITAGSYWTGTDSRRVVINIDTLTIRIDSEDAQRLRDALDRVVNEGKP